MRKSTGSLLPRQQHRRDFHRARPEPVHRLAAPVSTPQVDVTQQPAGSPRLELPPDQLVFRKFKRHLFNQILQEEGLKFDRDGRQRTACSLRHTYISTRLMEGANIHQIANNCRTSVKMIEEFYAAHIKDRLDAGVINVKRPRTRRAPAKPRTTGKPEARPDHHQFWQMMPHFTVAKIFAIS